MNQCSLKWIGVLGIGFLAVEAGSEDKAVPEGQKDESSYAIGVDLARSIQQAGVEVDIEMLLKGMKDALSGTKMLMSQEDLGSTMMMTFQLEQKQGQFQAGTGPAADPGDGKTTVDPPAPLSRRGG
jgi:hypothetical protein